MALNNKDSLIDLIMDADSILNDYLTTDEYEPFGEAFCEVINVIRNAKPVVHGEWKGTECGTMCSHCHRVYDSDFEIRHSVCIKLAHCPSCGADMRKENNNGTD